MDDIQAVRGSPEDAIPNTSYGTLAPILMIHIKKLWINGHVASIKQIIDEVLNLDSRARPEDITRYFSDHKDFWEPERIETLRAFEAKQFEDRTRITEHIDSVYDRTFDQIRSLANKAIRNYQNQEYVDAKSLKDLVSAAKILHECQRTTRNIISDKRGGGVGGVGDLASDEFKQATASILGFIQNATINKLIGQEAEILPPIQASDQHDKILNKAKETMGKETKEVQETIAA